MNELIINNRRVDLSENTNIGLTFCANNIGELQNRQGNFSNTFKLPISKNNKEIFEWSHLQTSSSLMPYKKNKATYIQNGIEIISDGVAEIQYTDNDYFYVNVYSGNLDLMEAIGDATVGDLYKNDIIYNWNYLNNRDKRDASDYFVYPFIDWRSDIDTFFTTDSIDVREMLPCAVMSKLFDRLANYTGFNFSGNYLKSNSHLNMILTPDSFTIPKSDAVITSQKLISPPSPYVQIPTGSATTYVNYYPSFRNENNINDFALGVFKPSVNKIGKLKFAGDYELYLAYSMSGVFPVNKKKAYVDVSFTDVSGTVVVYGPIKHGPFDYGLSKVEIKIETPEMTFLANTEYKVKLTAYVQQTNKGQVLNLTDYQTFVAGQINVNYTAYNRYLNFTPSPKIAYNTPIDFTKIFKMKVKDVLKDILNMEGIIIQTNNYTKTIQFNKFDDLVLNKANAKDWSSKIQNSTDISFKFGNYAKKNNVKFKTESDNDSYFTLTQETLEVERDVIKLNHDATIETNRYNGYIIPKIDALKDATNEWDSPTYRILYLKIQSTSFYINYIDGVTTHPVNDYLPFCDFKKADQLIEENYSTIIDILKSPKVLKIVAKLDVTDISDLDFSIPIQIQRPDLNLSGYFYINKIENYKGDLTSCEIIEI